MPPPSLINVGDETYDSPLWAYYRGMSLGVTWRTDYLARWRVSGDAGSVPAGPAMTTLRSVVARLAALVRCASVLFTALQVTIWLSFYSANSWRLAGPVAAVTWASAVVVYLRRRPPSPLFACVDSAVYTMFALFAQGSVPPGVHDHAFSWLVIGISSQLIVPAWYAPAALSAPLALALPAAYWLGAWQMAGTQVKTATAAAILLVLIAGTHAMSRRQLYARAAAADAALGIADRAASEQYVVLSRNIERREHERLLHDTILNTLTAIARAGGGDVAEMVRRCRQDVALIEGALTESDAAGAGFGDVVTGVRAVAAQLRARGLTVHVEVDGTGERAVPSERAVPGKRAVPANVATALANAAREALVNVAEHAGTREAWVEVSLGQSGAASGALHVTVRDRGTGFDLASVDPVRLGLRRSITERIADCGGHASIVSAPGHGTVVRLSWPADAADAADATDATPC